MEKVKLVWNAFNPELPLPKTLFRLQSGRFDPGLDPDSTVLFRDKMVRDKMVPRVAFWVDRFFGSKFIMLYGKLKANNFLRK